jgi:outer membrane lipase/esterase
VAAPIAARTGINTMNSSASTRLAALLLCASASALPLHPANAGTTLVLGDSLSDSGNAFRLTGGAFPDPLFYKDGRLSNGPIWADRLAPGQGYYADLLAGAPTSKTVDGWNFAVAGALSGAAPLDPVTLSAPGLLTQVRDYRAFAAAGRIPASARATSAIIWAGANDHGARATDPTRTAAGDAAFVDTTVANLRAATSELASGGLREIVLLNQFDFSRAPTTQLFPDAVRAAGDAMTSAHNAKLLQVASDLNASSSARVILVDVERLLDDIAAHPSAYGFTNVTRPCLPDDGAPECLTTAEADKRLFWDGTHLTSAAHGLVHGAIVATRTAAVEAPRHAAAIGEISLSLTDAHRRTFGSHLNSAARTSDGRLSVSLAADDSRDSRAAIIGRSDYRLNTRTFGIGADYAVADAIRLGALVTRTTGDARIGGLFGNAETRAVTASGFVTYAAGSIIVAAQAGHAWLDFDLERDTAFAPAQRAKANTEGTALFADASASFAVTTGPLKLQPGGSLRWTRLRVDGWQEREGGIMNLRAERQRRESLIGSVGAKASLALPAAGFTLVPYGSANYERELLDGDWQSAVVLGSGQRFNVTATPGDRSWFAIDAGVSALAGERLEALVGYETRLGRGKDEARAVKAGVKYRF